METKTTGQAVLEMLAAAKGMHLREIASRLGVSTDTVRCSSARLADRGLIDRDDGYYTATDTGRAFIAQGHVYRNGSQKGDFIGRTRLSLRSRAWNMMRMRTTWSIDDLLMAIADGTEKDAENSLKRYVNVLCRAGYVERTPRNPQLYRLVNNTGRFAPAYNSPARTVTDLNTGEVCHV